MEKVAVFGKPGSGKSRLAKRLAAHLGLNYYSLDLLQYNVKGELLDKEAFLTKHSELLNEPGWVIDGLGVLSGFEQRLQCADTLIYLDLPYWVSYWFVTKRLVKGILVTPEGWPKGSSVIKGSLASYRFLRLSRAFWNDTLLTKLNQMTTHKQLIHVTSVKQLNAVICSIQAHCR